MGQAKSSPSLREYASSIRRTTGICVVCDSIFRAEAEAIWDERIGRAKVIADWLKKFGDQPSATTDKVRGHFDRHR